MSTICRTAILAVALLSLSVNLDDVHAQRVGRQPLRFSLSEPVERLEMIVNTSRILTTEHSIPKLLVDNERIVKAQPIAPNQVQLSALHTGFTTLTVWDEKGNEHSVDVLVYGDARELENLLMTEFPDATLRVRPLASSIVVSGYVPRADMVSRIVQISEDYYPNVINNVTVGGVQQVLLHVRVMEVSRTKLRKMGFDWAVFTDNGALIQNAAGLINEYTISPAGGTVTSTRGENLVGAILNDGEAFFGFLEALRQHNLVKVLAEPTLVTVSGRPASFSSGGEFPILVPQNSLGSLSIEYREFGTRVDFVPIVLGNGRVRLEVRPQVSEIDPTRGVSLGTETVPGLRTRWADTAVEMNAGQTLALAGLIQSQIESENRGLPYLADLPWIGAAFRRVQERTNEIELLITVTPEFVSALDPHELPPCGPGQLTASPNDQDFYWRGYLEVPKCCGDGSCSSCLHGAANPAGYQQQYEQSDLPEPELEMPLEPVSHTPRVRPLRESGSAPAAGLIGPSGYDELP